MDYEEIIDISHFIDYIKLIIKSVYIFLGRIIALKLTQTKEALVFKVFEVVHFIRHLKVRELCVSEFELHVTHIGDFFCNIDSLGQLRKGLSHLAFTLYIKFVSAEL